MPRERASVCWKDLSVALAEKMWQRRSPQRSATITCTVEPQRGAIIEGETAESNRRGRLSCILGERRKHEERPNTVAAFGLRQAGAKRFFSMLVLNSSQTVFSLDISCACRLGARTTNDVFHRIIAIYSWYSSSCSLLLAREGVVNGPFLV